MRLTRFNLAKSELLGPLLWVSSIQYFIVQLIVIAAWTVPHSWKNNFISDLGNTECAPYAGLAVCSPLHLVMNVSFIVFGLTMAIGSLYLLGQFERTKLSRVAFALMMLSGLGTILVGLFPENTVGPLHVFGAFLGLGVGNLSVLLMGISLRPIHPAIRVYTVISACISLTAFALFAIGVHLGLGRGGMERLISYPFTVWMIVFGLYVLFVRFRTRS